MKIDIENKNQLLAAKYKYERIIFYIYGDTCKPCQELKPKLFELLKSHDDSIVVAMINYKTSKEMNEYFNLKKIPYLVMYKDSKKMSDIQSSKLELIKPCLSESFGMEFVPEAENDDFFLDDDDF